MKPTKNDRATACRLLRQLREQRGWSWADQARALRAVAEQLGVTASASTQLSSLQRSIARWESTASRTVPGERYQLLLAQLYAHNRRNTSTRYPPSGSQAISVCEDCGRDYAQARDECPDCGCLETQLVDTGSAGRFWGYRGLRPMLAIRQVTPEVGIAAGRVLRRWYRSKGLTKQVTVVRVNQATGRVYYRRSRKRKWLFGHNRGFVTVNGAPAMASQLARYLAT